MSVDCFLTLTRCQKELESQAGEEAAGVFKVRAFQRAVKALDALDEPVKSGDEAREVHSYMIFIPIFGKPDYYLRFPALETALLAGSMNIFQRSLSPKKKKADQSPQKKLRATML